MRICWWWEVCVGGFVVSRVDRYGEGVELVWWVGF